MKKENFKKMKSKFKISIFLILAILFASTTQIRVISKGYITHLKSYNHLVGLSEVKILKKRAATLTYTFRTNFEKSNKFRFFIFKNSAYKKLTRKSTCNDSIKLAWGEFETENSEPIEGVKLIGKIHENDKIQYFISKNTIDFDFRVAVTDCDELVNYKTAGNAKYKFTLEIDIDRIAAPFLTIMIVLIIFLIFFALYYPQISKFMEEINKSDSDEKSANPKNFPLIVIFICLSFKLVGLFLELITMSTCYRHCSDSPTLNFLTFLHHILEHLGSYFFSVLLVLIGHGYTLYFSKIIFFHGQGKDFEFFMPLALIIAFIKICVLGLTSPWDVSSGHGHKYQGFGGAFIAAVQIIYGVYFAIGIYEIYGKAWKIDHDQKLMKFIVWFGVAGVTFFCVFPVLFLTFESFELFKLIFELVFMFVLLAVVKGAGMGIGTFQRFLRDGSLYKEVSTVFGGRGLWMVDRDQ